MNATYQFIYLITIFLNLAITISIFIRRMNNPMVRTFLLLVISIVGWLISLFAFYTVFEHDWVIFLGRLNFFFAIGVSYFSFLFFYYFPKIVYKISKRSHLLIAVLTLSLAIITVSTDLVDRNEIIDGTHRITVFGPLFFLFIIYSFVAFFASVLIVINKRKYLKDQLLHQMHIFLFGWGIGMIFVIITNLIVPLLFENYELQNLGPLATISIVIATAYAVAKHEMLNIKAVASELFVLVILLFFLINIVMSSEPYQYIMGSIMFGLGLVIGYALIDSVRKEVERREELQRITEELAIANQKLEDRDAMRSEFISMASHQLRTPVSVMKGYMSLMLDGTFGKIPGKVIEKIQHMYEMNERLILMVNNMLNASRIEKNRIDFGFGEVNINKLAESVIEEMTYKAELKGLELRLKKPANEQPLIVSDEEKIREIIVNLIDNAIKYSGKGYVELGYDYDTTNRHINFYVRDTGYGMTEEDAKRVFEKFYRAENKETPKENGTGLGLYIVTRFITGMGGEIWVSETSPGKGSTFMFTIPFSPSEESIDDSDKLSNQN